MKFPWKRVIIGVILAVSIGSAIAYTYTRLREDIGKIIPDTSYNTIIAPDSPLRNSIPNNLDCNGGFSPNPCTMDNVHPIPETPTYLLLLIGFIALLVFVRRPHCD